MKPSGLESRWQAKLEGVPRKTNYERIGANEPDTLGLSVLPGKETRRADFDSEGDSCKERECPISAKRPAFYNSLSFADGEELIGSDPGEAFLRARRPVDFHVCRRHFTQAEMQAWIIGR
jgi:hypothetical protein